MERTEDFDAPASLDMCALFEVLAKTTQDLAATFHGCLPGTLYIETSKGSTQRDRLSDVPGAIELLGGEPQSLTATFSHRGERIIEDQSVSVTLRRDTWHKSNRHRGYIRVQGPDDHATVGFSSSLIDRIKTAVATEVARIPAPANDSAPSRGPRPQLRLPSARSFRYVRLRLYALQQIEDELARLGPPEISSTDFESVSNVREIIKLHLGRIRDLRLASSGTSPTSGAYGHVRLDIGFSARVMCDGDSPEAWATYARIGAILDATSRRTRRYARTAGVIALLSYVLSIGVTVGAVGQQHAKTANWLTIVLAVLSVIQIVAVLSYSAIGLMLGPTRLVGLAGKETWLTRNRDALFIALGTTGLGVLVTVLITYVH